MSLRHFSMISIACFLSTACLSQDRSRSVETNASRQIENWEEYISEYGMSASFSPVMAAVIRLQQDALRNDGQIDGNEADSLLAFTKKYNSVQDEVAEYLSSLASDRSIVSSEAAEILSQGDWSKTGVYIPLHNDIYEIDLGNQDFLFDDVLRLKMNGRIEGGTGIRSHSRGYAAKSDGVLFTRHGSYAPHYSSTNTQEETQILHEQGPDYALDAAAEIFGLHLDSWNTFSYVSRDRNYYDPSDETPYWAGICQGWTHNALDERLNVLLDVEGEEGERGLWIFGQWISRADLGNAMMGASYSLGIADSYTVDSFVTPKTLIQGLAQYVLNSGIGIRVDIWNDEHNDTGYYNPQIWNQPIVDASIEVNLVSNSVADDIIAYAHAHASSWSPLPEELYVRRVQATATWGAEANDGWEKAPLFRTSEWNMYFVTDSAGTVLEGYMAYDLVDAGMHNLPFSSSDGLPDYIAVPRHELTDAALENAEHRLLREDNGEGARYRFLVGIVLARGIPNETRFAFEHDFFMGSYQLEELSRLYPTVANAYSPAMWHEVFEERLGSGSTFGAVWK